jgi:hypothetical protein
VEPFPSFEDQPRVVGDLHVVDERLRVAPAFHRTSEPPASARDAVDCQALHRYREHDRLRDARLERVDRRVAQPGVAEHEVLG